MPPMAAAPVSNPKTRRNPKTSTDRRDALSAPNDTMIFVESSMDLYDALAPVTNSSNKGADLDYGPRGPQHRDKLQLRSATLALFFDGR
jgi:indolepyruvate decarboxylase